MSDIDDARYSPLFVGFIHYFNVERDYFECHEVLEELWLERGRDLLYQGLLQVAVALYHHRNGNVNGARKLFRGALNKLAGYPGDSLGIDLTRLLRESKAILQSLEQEQAAPFRDLDIQVSDPVLLEQVRRWGEGRKASE